MKNSKIKRLVAILSLFSCVSLGIFIILSKFQDSIVFFYHPSEIYKKNISAQKNIRVGGVIKEGSIKQKQENIEFVINDLNKELLISYKGILPNLFREKQGIVVKGYLINNVLIADEVLTKHDEYYMPREIAANDK